MTNAAVTCVNMVGVKKKSASSVEGLEWRSAGWTL